MKYYTKKHTDTEPTEITKDKAIWYLEGTYKKEAIEEAVADGKAFRLNTPYRDVWTKGEDGRVPMPGLYGICD